MINNYEHSILDEKVNFRFDGWFKIRKNHLQETSIIWIKNDKMMFDDGIYNSKTPIMFF
ncbi:hypothetical protein [Lutibacter citreus]|uniref:hypothetical protein n=1 Tax=Lutibacter citreus TaxID=2138210 RepID=UPI00130096AF|nr:hypothetical protein [Lutibacter citreus]